MTATNSTFFENVLPADCLQLTKEIAKFSDFCMRCCSLDLCNNSSFCQNTFNNTRNGNQNGTTTNPSPTQPAVNYEMVQAAIIVASIIWFVILAAVLYRVCQRYRSTSRALLEASAPGRTTPQGSMDNYIAEWLRDRPPSYRQSYRHMMPEDAPPIYDDLVENQSAITVKENILPSYEMAIGVMPPYLAAPGTDQEPPRSTTATEARLDSAGHI